MTCQEVPLVHDNFGEISRKILCDIFNCNINSKINWVTLGDSTQTVEVNGTYSTNTSDILTVSNDYLGISSAAVPMISE